MEKTIICIGREYGSGGHAIGKILAKRTGYEFYDKDRFIAIAKERGFEGEVEEYLEEQPMNSLLYSIALNYHINTRLKAKRKIEEIDEKRSAFRKEFTGQEWGQSKYYNLSVDTTHLTFDQAADLILYYKKLAEESHE